MSDLNKPAVISNVNRDFVDEGSYAEEASHHSFPDAQCQQEDSPIHPVVRALAPFFFVGLLVWLGVLIVLGL